MSSIAEVNSTNFDTEVLQTPGLVLVDFWAPWCGPCKMQTPILEKISGDVNAKIVKLNTDDSPTVAQQFSISAIPTLILFKDGKEHERFIGVQPEAVLKEKLS